ncbi:MAG TPA: PAS domain S-box protein [Myxococcota bacterium]|nr:PAS domain S-box protein [Myxococcota bacterium]
MPRLPLPERQAGHDGIVALVHGFAEPALLVRAGFITAINELAQQLLGGGAPGVPLSSVLRPILVGALGGTPADLFEGTVGATVTPARVLRADGAELDLEVTISPLAIEQASGCCFLVLRDVGSRDTREAQRVRGYRRLIDRAPDLMITHDLTGRITYTNSSSQRALGYAPGEMVGMQITQIVAASRGESSRGARSEDDAASTLYEAELIAKDGTMAPYEISSSLVGDERGPRARLLIARDISARRYAEQALRKSDEAFRAAADGSFDALFLLESVRDEIGQLQDFRVVDLNRRALKLGRVRRNRVLGRPIRELLSQKTHDDFFKKCAWVMESRETFEEEIAPNASEIDAVWLRYQIVPLVDGVAVTARDVTERRRLEEELRHSQKMEAVGRLAGGIAHDFNNLLTAINGYSGLLLERVPRDHPLRPDLQEIHRAGERAAALTHQLLAFSRRQVLKPERLDLNAVISEMENMLRRLIGEHIEVRTNLAPDLGHVRADRGQIQQVLMNLVVNARDAMEAGGVLTLETANFRDAARRREVGAPAGRHVMLVVSDTGCGMDEEILAHIFEPFFTTKPSGKGTGLGLSTVYGIIQQSGGHLSAHSRPGAGSVFRVFLPLDEKSEDSTPLQPLRTSAARGRETVLLVEDEPLVGRLAERVLTQAGYTVVYASNGLEARNVFGERKGAVDILVTDVVMPRMGGPQLAGLLRAEQPGLRVLFLSGYNDGAVLSGTAESGTSFLGKPFTAEALSNEVRRLLDGGSEG